ncbi:branched-chain amino acid ABC transporter permease [Streptomyces rugosispiralis]|uniref:Branched-chain amino acid ABC transporter permease n=1 Tax=Streptomyces rugosispiralis TaxID=2967341 RepID=A0ABT1V5H0_9ACTN|nr:branched-chain amino acid ABC transporter permease [Streptomyces rugosispiralis]MCQ8192634.1 branched-chain amino acid ABC transporter permease [Streptomyces rugosispiralis]
MTGLLKSPTTHITGFAIAIASLPFWLIPNSGILAIAIVALLYAAAATAFNLTAGLGGQLSFGHSIFFGLGAYATALLRQDLGWNVWAAVPVALTIAVVAALALALPSARLGGVYFVLVSFVATLALESIATWASDVTGGAAGISLTVGSPAPAELRFENPLGHYYVALILLTTFLGLFAAVTRSNFGLRLRAVRDDPAAAAASGIAVARQRTVSLLVSAALTSLVGVAYLQYISYIDPTSAFGSMTASMIAMPALFGGLGTLWGPVLGATVLISVQQTLNPAFSGLPAGLGLIVFGVLVMALQTIEPKGAVHLLRSGLRHLGQRLGTSKRTAQPAGDSLT